MIIALLTEQRVGEEVCGREPMVPDKAFLQEDGVLR